MVTRLTGVALSMITISVGLLAQQPTARSFEVASVKPHAGPMRRIGVYTTGNRLNADAQSVRGLIMFAYDVRNDQIPSTEPLSVVSDVFYDVVATANGTPTRAEFRQMMQVLLAERFKLKFHREVRETPVYALVVGRNGSKFHASAPDAGSMSHLGMKGQNYELTMPKATMDDLAESIINSAFLDRPVLNKTGLKGTYGIKLTFTPKNRIKSADGADLDVISIFIAVQEQLGLRLVDEKAEVESLLVDEVQKPSEN